MILCVAASPFALGADKPAADVGRGNLVYPGATWQTRRPEEVGLQSARLDDLSQLVRGRGCVIRHGYLVYSWGDLSKSADIASAFKPVISALLFLAVQEGKLKSVDDPVATHEPRLKELNGGKDGHITWRHLASQTSGYVLAESPGRSYAYNDYALALYYDVLTQKVYRGRGTEVLKTRLADALQFQDRYSFEAFGPNDRPGRLAVSVRDLARFGLRCLRGGEWKDKQIIRPEFIRLALSSPVPADLPLTRAKNADMLPRQRSLGGGKNITSIGPGYYSFNWWLNRINKQGNRLFPEAPPDTYVASGHGGERMLWIIPSLDLIVSWNDADVQDQDASPSNPNTKCNKAARLMREAVAFSPHTSVTLVGGRWHLNGKVTYAGAKAEGLLMNVRMVNAVFEDRKRPAFDPESNADRFIAQIPGYAAQGVRAFTICLQGGFPGYEGAVNSAFQPDGSLRESYLRRVQRVIEACDRQRMVVILGCYYQRQDQILRNEKAVRAGVANVVKWIKGAGFTNVVLEIANEFPHPGFDHAVLKTVEGQVQLLRLAKEASPDLLVSTSGIGDGRLPESVAKASDFLLIHFNGVAVKDIPSRIKALTAFGKAIVCNEDNKVGEEGAKAAELSVSNDASWGLMHEKLNQHFPFTFLGPKDDLLVYAKLKELTSCRVR